MSFSGPGPEDRAKMRDAELDREREVREQGAKAARKPFVDRERKIIALCKSSDATTARRLKAEILAILEPWNTPLDGCNCGQCTRERPTSEWCKGVRHHLAHVRDNYRADMTRRLGRIKR